MDDLASGTEFAGYRIEAVAGRGGMGVVYRATQLGLDRPVALKVIAPGLLSDPRARERFLRESRAAAAIEHPNVIPIYASGEHRGWSYIVMRFVDGDDVGQRIARSGALAPREAATLVAQVGSALDAAHEAGLVHRDVKPANILLGSRDHAYLTDFGLARHALSNSGLTAPGGWVGTLDFVAPEQIRGDRVDGRADIYALGCVLYFALTGLVAYARDSDEARLWAHLHAAPPQPSLVDRDIPPAFDEVVRRALEKRPEQRQSSAGELGATALDAAGDAAIVRPARTRRIGRRPAPSASVTWADGPAPRRRPPVAGALAVLVAAAAGAGTVLLINPAGHRTVTTAQDRRAPGTTRQARTTPAPAATSHAVAAPHVDAQIRVGTRPVNVEVAGGSAWIASTGTSTLGRVRAADNRRLRGPRLGFGISDVAVRRGELWITVAGQRQVVHLRAASGRMLAQPIAMNGQPRAVDAGEGAVWVAEQFPTGPDNLVEIDPHTATVVGRMPVPEGINDIRAANGAVWVVGRKESTLLKVSAASRKLIVRLHVGRGAQRVAVAAGYVWVTDYGDNAVTRVNPKGPQIVTIGVRSRPYGLHARPDGVWVACYGDQSVVRIDPRTSRVVGKPIPVGLNPVAVDVSHGSLWVTSVGDNRVTRVRLRR